MTNFCPSCGAALRPEVRFCENCGTRVAADAPSPAAPPPPPTRVSPPPSPASPPPAQAPIVAAPTTGVGASRVLRGCLLIVALLLVYVGIQLFSAYAQGELSF